MDFHSILGKLRAIESLGIKDRIYESETCNMTAEGEMCPVHGLDECSGYSGTIQMGEATAVQRDLDPRKPVLIHGVKGVKSRPFIRKFRNMTAAEKWMDDNAEDIEVSHVENDHMEEAAKTDQNMSSSASAGAKSSMSKCPPATQDIALNLENRQKAIDEYGYGPLNPNLPNKKFWSKKVDEWNLDSVEEAKHSLCGNCAAFDQRAATLDCIAKGIGSDLGSEDPTVEAGDLGYCRFLKFKCASRRTCDAWVSGGPLTDKQKMTQGKAGLVRSNQRYGKIAESNYYEDDMKPTTDPYEHGYETGVNGLSKSNNPYLDSDDEEAIEAWHQGWKDGRKDMGQTSPVDDIDEGQCNMTAEGEMCPVHGMAECMSMSMEEDAPLGPPPFTGIGATNNGPDTQGFVYAYTESKRQIRESMDIMMNQSFGDQGSKKSMSITATDEDAAALARLLVTAGMLPAQQDHAEPQAGRPYSAAEPCCSHCQQPMSRCGCEQLTMENADYDYGHDEKSEEGIPVDPEDYIYQGRHTNQRFVRSMGDNPMMAEQAARAQTLFAKLNEEYRSFLAEADLEHSNAGSQSPLTYTDRDKFDKDPFHDEDPVTDGSRSPLSHIGRQDVMN